MINLPNFLYYGFRLYNYTEMEVEIRQQTKFPFLIHKWALSDTIDIIYMKISLFKS